MPSYLVEVYAPGRAELSELVGEARSACCGHVRYLRSIFCPEDETCFHLFESPSMEALATAGERARVPVARIVEAVEATELPPDRIVEEVTNCGRPRNERVVEVDR